jgi:hypothetical protein
MDPAFKQITMAREGFKNAQQMCTLLKTLNAQYPNLLKSAPSNSPSSPLIHELVSYRISKNVLELCIQIGGQSVRELGDSQGKTPIFRAYSYRLLKRVTALGADVNVRSGADTILPWTVLEHFVKAFQGPSLISRRCVKHLLGLGACIQVDSPLTSQERLMLTSVYQEFSKEITTVKEKVDVVKQWIGVAVLHPLILDYALGEEDSETPEYDYQGKYAYALDDETEAYAYIKRSRTISIS